MKKAKSILFEVEIEGQGIVNYDSVNQKKLLAKTRLGSSIEYRFNNTTFAKKNLYEGEEGKIDYKIKISSDCLRNGLFSKDMVAQSPNLIHHKTFLMTFLGSPVSILRGYMFFGTSEAYKKKSPITIVDAEQTCNALSIIETFAKSGEKAIVKPEEEADEKVTEDKGEKEDTKSDNTFFKKETIGNIKYATRGSLNLNELQFVSVDTIYDRMALNPDDFPLYKSFLNSQISNFNSEIGYYKMANTISEVPELGFRFSNENVVSLTKEFFKRLQNLSINRNSAYAKTAKVRYKIVYDVVEDTFDNRSGWVEINNLNTVDKMNFDMEDAYVVTDSEEAVKNREDIIKESKKLIEGDKVKKDAAKVKRDADKAAKAAAKLEAEQKLKEAQTEATL